MDVSVPLKNKLEFDFRSKKVMGSKNHFCVKYVFDSQSSLRSQNVSNLFLVKHKFGSKYSLGQKIIDLKDTFHNICGSQRKYHICKVVSLLRGKACPKIEIIGCFAMP